MTESEVQPALAGTPTPPVAPDPFADPAAGRMRDRSVPETAEQRSRRCPFPKSCNCDHTQCREGWLDEDQPDPIPSDPMHVRTVRCPSCNDARVMHFELAGMKGKR